MNFSGETQPYYRLGLPRGGRWEVVLDTAGYHPDAPSSAGMVIEAAAEPWNSQPFSAAITVPRFSTVWLVPVQEPAVGAAATGGAGEASAQSLPAGGQPDADRPTTNGDPS
jgi:1,4-alpha-glucan branching enzyme